MRIEPLHIDGSAGEGGGQVLRSSLALSMALGVPFRITNIRARREKPGLMRQHLTAVQAAVAISSAQCEGAEVGSRELMFVPGPVRGGQHRFVIGTAGSTTLVLQAIVPPLLFADEPSELLIEGGTHTRWAPPFEFFERALVPVLRRLGAEVETTLERHGFYPAGGGAIRVRIHPARTPQPVTLHERGAIMRRTAEIIVAKLAADIARRELDVLSAKLPWALDESAIRVITDSISPGNAIILTVASEGCDEAFCTLGEHGKRAESVANDAVDLMRHYVASNAAVGIHLADQLMVPLAIASARGAGRCGFTTLPLTQHARTNHDVVAAFLARTSPENAPRVEQLAAIDGTRPIVRWEVGRA